VTLPATILTATVAGTPGPGVSVPPPGVHIPSHTGPLVPPPQAQVYNYIKYFTIIKLLTRNESYVNKRSN